MTGEFYGPTMFTGRCRGGPLDGETRTSCCNRLIAFVTDVPSWRFLSKRDLERQRVPYAVEYFFSGGEWHTAVVR